MRVRELFGAICLAALVLTGCDNQQPERPFRIGSHVSPMSTGVRGVLTPWVDQVRAENPDFVIRTFWGGTLGKDGFKQYDLVANGVLDAGWVLPDYTAGQFPETGLFALPGLFSSGEEASHVGWALYQEGLLSGFDKVELIGFFTTEPNALFMREPISSLGDLRQKKVRSLGSIQGRWLEDLGASPQALSAVDMNQALAKGALDGAIQGWTGMKTFKSFPLVKQGFAVPIGVTPFMLVANRKSWEALPAQVQQSMRKWGGEAMAGTGARAYGDASAAIQTDIASDPSFTTLRPDPGEQAAFQREAEAVHRWWIARTPNGQQIYDRAVELRDAYRAKAQTLG